MSLADFFQAAPPDVAIEIDHGHVGAARLIWRGGQAVIAAHATEPLPSGAVVPSLATLNMPDVPLVAQAIRRVLAQLGTKATRVALVIPDTVAKVSLLKLENIPPKAADLQEIVRWQVRKSAPFPIEQAVVSVTPGAASPEGGHELVVSLARADVVQQYEQACEMAGAHAGLVDLATFSVINGILAGQSAPSGDWLLVHVTDSYLTLAVIRDRSLLFFRNRSEEGEGTLADLIHQTAMYYEDRLHGGGFARVLIAGAARLPSGAETVRRGLEERLGINVESVDPRAAASLVDRIGASPELLDVLAPLVGMLLREQRVA
ncbi:MAG: pilus assembly protein PilM [Acidobacteriota bacterium]|nr:pilus assembly protein PilM [Acidobacteriota bacterium]